MPQTPNSSKTFVTMVVFRGSNQGDPNLSNICRKFEKKKDNFWTNFRQIFDKFLTNLSPPHWKPEKQSSGQTFDKFGVRGIFECCKGAGANRSSLRLVFQSPLSGPLIDNRLNAMLSLLHLLDRYRTPSAILWSSKMINILGFIICEIFFTGLGRLANIYRNFGVSTESEW